MKKMNKHLIFLAFYFTFYFCIKMYDANLFDVPIGLYTTTKKQTRLAYENRVKEFKNDEE